MRIQINNQILEVKSCKTFLARTFGMMGIRKKKSYGYYFPKCSSLHTCFMMQSIDIIMVDKNNIVVAFYSHIKPWRMVSHRHANSCYEFSCGILSNVSIGTKIEIR